MSRRQSQSRDGALTDDPNQRINRPVSHVYTQVSRRKRRAKDLTIIAGPEPVQGEKSGEQGGGSGSVVEELPPEEERKPGSGGRGKGIPRGAWKDRCLRGAFAGVA